MNINLYDSAQQQGLTMQLLSFVQIDTNVFTTHSNKMPFITFQKLKAHINR